MKITRVALLLGLTLCFAQSAYAKSCSEVKDTCLAKMAQVRGYQGSNPASLCSGPYEACLQTGVWSAGSTVIKGLSKN
jgi:hypothetical protein